ncbi:hypothetical protein IP88_02980 [alpha proteobacterium AAP81b]|nr:hypothetical protein IP88_02980 [alpha proteobacterium AAP81b]
MKRSERFGYLDDDGRCGAVAEQLLKQAFFYPEREADDDHYTVACMGHERIDRITQFVIRPAQRMIVSAGQDHVGQLAGATGLAIASMQMQHPSG